MDHGAEVRQREPAVPGLPRGEENERGAMDLKDSRDDAALTERSATMPPLRRRHAATPALWRLRAPLFAFELDAEWGRPLSTGVVVPVGSVGSVGSVGTRRALRVWRLVKGVPSRCASLPHAARHWFQRPALAGQNVADARRPARGAVTLDDARTGQLGRPVRESGQGGGQFGVCGLTAA